RRAGVQRLARELPLRTCSGPPIGPRAERGARGRMGRGAARTAHGGTAALEHGGGEDDPVPRGAQRRGGAPRDLVTEHPERAESRRAPCYERLSSATA